jgi:hypothetical protein
VRLSTDVDVSSGLVGAAVHAGEFNRRWTDSERTHLLKSRYAKRRAPVEIGAHDSVTYAAANSLGLRIKETKRRK